MSKTSPKTGFKAGIVQLTSGLDPEVGLARTSELIREAAGKGAQYIQTPENSTFMDLDGEATLRRVQPFENHPQIASFCTLAAELGIWLHIGSIALLTKSGKAANKSLLIDPMGIIQTVYDKIHLFDADLGGDESYRESDTYIHGREAILFSLPWGNLGFSICYDLRFPGFYRQLAKAGADFLAIPAAFTKVSGEAHWHVLTRARAIENGCYVFAAAQGGKHENGRDTFGHSMIIDPWGEVIAEAPEAGEYVICADIDTNLVEETRKRIPSLHHDQPYSLG